MIKLPKLVEERQNSRQSAWPTIHCWSDGVIAVEEKANVLIYNGEWRRYEWAALSDMPKSERIYTGSHAMAYLAKRFPIEAKTDT